MSNWTRDFIFGCCGMRIDEKVWASVAAQRRKPRPAQTRIRYDNARPVPKQVTEGLLIAMADCIPGDLEGLRTATHGRRMVGGDRGTFALGNGLTVAARDTDSGHVAVQFA
jgi:hypothetical protein